VKQGVKNRDDVRIEESMSYAKDKSRREEENGNYD